MASLAVGCWWGSKSIPAKRKGPDLHILQERIMHAKNVTMRMEELLHKEQKLADEQESYSALVSLKEETEWLLSLVEAQVLKGNRLGRHRVFVGCNGQDVATGLGHWAAFDPPLDNADAKPSSHPQNTMSRFQDPNSS